MPIPNTQPNILLILADDHGYGDVSANNEPNIHTPGIDRIASEGVWFTRFYANSTVCSPSRAALMTGRYPDRVGVPGVIRTDPGNNWGYFDPAAATLPDMLRRAGYDTIHVGKWHLGLEEENHPCSRGFDRFYGFLGDMMDDYYTHRRHGHNYMRRAREVIDPQGHATDLFTEWAEAAIRERADGDVPFFLYLAYNAPHSPIQPREDWVDRVRRREPEIDDRRARYLALVEHMDDGIARVLDALDETGQAENTLVIYASDNGGVLRDGACNGPLRGEKQDMYEGGIRVPCCVRWPGRIAPGARSDQVAMLMDLYPTLCQAAGVEVTHQIEGLSLLPLLLGADLDFTNRFSERFYYWVRREGGCWRPDRCYLGQAYRAVRHRDLKLLQNDPFSPLELYDLGDDEREQRDLRSTGHPGEQDLRRYLQQQIRAAGAIPWQKRS